MLETTETETLHERYGDLIAAVAQQVASEFAAPSGKFGHGWEVVTSDEVEQDTYAQLIETGIGADALDEMRDSRNDGGDAAEAWLRTTARLYGAANQARARRRDLTVDFTEPNGDGLLTLGGRLAIETPADWGEPEREADLGSPLIDAALTVVSTIVSTLEGVPALVAEAFYLRGLDQRSISETLGVRYDSVRKHLQTARQHLGPHAEASLRAWREFAHPDAVKPWSTKKAGVPYALVDVVSAINRADASI